MSNKKKTLLYKVVNEFEVYIGSYIFVAMTALLFLQVVSRYVFHYSFVWAEELSVILFVWMLYFGIVAAVLARKQIRIDAFINILPFKWKKIMLIMSNVFTIIFCAMIFAPMNNLISNLLRTGAKTPLLKIPKGFAMMILPVAMVLLTIRLVQESVRLWKESEKDLGAAKPSINFDEIEAEMEADKLAKQAITEKAVEGGAKL